MGTLIEWAQETINPMPGCTLVSPACDHCYAERLASTRLAHLPQYHGLTTGGRWNGSTRFVPGELEKPFRWKRPKRVFVNSMGDLFHERNSFEDLDAVFAMMAGLPRHTFLVLTKRPARMLEYMQSGRWWTGGRPFPLSNVWLGVTAEDQARANERIPLLLETPAAVRFVSVEPMLGPVDLAPWTTWPARQARELSRSIDYALAMGGSEPDDDFFGPALPPRKLDWVICGGETGPGARPMHPDWARSLRDQCAEAGVPYFFKQWGEWQDGSSRNGRNEIIVSDGRHAQDSSGFLPDFREWKSTGWGHLAPTMISRVGKRQAGRLLDGREHNEFPQTGCAAIAKAEGREE